MGKEERDAGSNLVDGQLVPMTGIHPFYLDMDFTDFLQLLVEWKVTDFQLDRPGHPCIILSKDGIEIELCFSETDLVPELGPLGFRHLSSISCENAFLNTSTRLSDISAEELRTATGVDMQFSADLSVIDASLDISVRAFTEIDPDSEFGFLINESDGLISAVTLIRTVPGTYIEE